MKLTKALLILLTVSILFACKTEAQLPTLPKQTLPNLKTPAWWEIGYMQADSGVLFESRDTLWHPRKLALVFWKHTGIDTTFWFWNLSKWQTLLSAVSGGGGAINWTQGYATYDSRYSLLTHTHSFASLTSKPTTLSGYGITDPVVLQNGSYVNPNWIASLPFNKINGRPTTLSGYGISDPIVLETNSYANPSFIASLAWGKITGTPTTLSGYNISDGLTQSAADARYSLLSHVHTFSSLTSKPTTLSGYGITDPVELNTNKVSNFSSPNTTTYPNTLATATALGAKMDTSVRTPLYVVWPIQYVNDSTAKMNQADDTHDGYQDSLNYTHSEAAYTFSQTFNLVSPSNGSVPKWNSTSGKWEVGTDNSGGVTDGDKGDISVTSGVWNIDPLAVTNAKINDMDASKLTGSINDARLSSNVTQNSATQTLSNKRWVARVGSTASSATPAINTDNYDIYKLTAQAADITGFTLTGTPNDGDILEIQITGTATRAITWGTSFVSSTVSLPNTTNSTATLTVVVQYYTTSSYGNNKWVCVNYY
jgi:hypothetical protein